MNSGATKTLITFAAAILALNVSVSSLASERNDMLSSERLDQFSASQKAFDAQARYGLIDQSDRFSYYNGLSSQKSAVLNEMAKIQADSRINRIKSEIDTNNPAARSAFFLAGAYLIYNGKMLSKKLTDSTEISARAKPSDKQVRLTQSNLSPLALTSGIDYRLNEGTVTTSLSRELIPHVTATVDRSHNLVSQTTENTGRISFGTSF